MEALPGVDEIVESGGVVELAFDVSLDWERDAARARGEAAWKAERCVAFLRSAEWKRRFGARPGVIRMRTTASPPADVSDEMVRLGVEVVTDASVISRGAARARCALCGRCGFLPLAMQMTGEGLACPGCFRAWESRLAPPARGLRPGRLSHYQMARMLLGTLALTAFFAMRACG